jgi:hypothetical protein
MEERRSFFYAQNFDSKGMKTDRLTKKLNGGGSCAHKDYTGMYGMQAAQL